jgi:large subunit ribosomal protein L25
MKSVPLSAYQRALVGRNCVKQVRAASRIPAVIYGRIAQPQNLELDSKELEDLLLVSASETILVDLAVKDDTRPQRLALVQEIQHHPLSGKALHVDLHEVSPDEKVTIMVPIEAVGEAAGVKNNGGVLEHVRFKLRVRALPKHLPEVLKVDVSHLEIGQSVHVGEIAAPEGVELLGDKGIPVLAVAAPITEAEEAAADAAAAPGSVEPEMIREKKEGAEGAEAAPAKGEKGAEKAPAAKAGDKPAEKAPEKKK